MARSNVSGSGRRTRRWSEREPAVTPRDKYNVRDGRLRSLTFAFGLRPMKRLFSSPDAVEVDLLSSRMEVAGFSCEVRNQSIRSSLGAAAAEYELCSEQEGKAVRLFAKASSGG